MVMVALAAAACGGDDDRGERAPQDDDSAATTTTATKLVDYTPVYEVVPCDGPLFAGRLPPEASGAECGTLTVPEDRTRSGGRQVVLPVAILRSTAPDKQPDPYVYFSGGPGDAGIEAGGRVLASGLLPTTRDFIWFDQRGTGRASPSLACPEVLEDAYDRYESTDDPVTEDERSVAALRTCLERLRDVADLAQYDTPTTGQDVEDLRVALGIDDWNIFGISYGTTVALEVLRSHPDHLRSAVLDSVYPTTADAAQLIDAADRVFAKLFEGCEKDSTCSARYPNFRADTEAMVAALDAQPYEVHYTDAAGTDRVANATGQDLVAGIFYAMYETDYIGLIPSIVDQVRRGEYGILDALGPAVLSKLGGNSDGQSFAVECADRQDQFPPGDVAEQRRKHPLYQQLISLPDVPESCDLLDVPSVDPAFGTIEETDVPTLVIGNEYDPITPPEDAERTAVRLGDAATFIRFPALGHGATGSHPCPQQIFREFLEDPGASVDTSCVEAMGSPAWSG